MDAKIVYKNVADLIPYASNSRVHSDEQVLQIASSIREFGFNNPVLTDGANGIIAGHGRLMAAKKLNMDTVPCIELNHLTKSERKAYIIADNKLSDNSDFDIDILKMEFEALKEMDFNLELTGFNIDEISDLLDEYEEKEGLTDDDDVPDVPESPVNVIGDIWVMGDHRLMCGDCTLIDNVEKLMDGVNADMVFTDPPYNTGMTEQIQSGQGGTLWKGNKKHNEKARLSHMFNDSYTDKEWQEFMSYFCASYDHSLKDNTFIYVCLDWRRSHELVPHLKDRWKFSNLIIWDKMVHGLGSDYKYTHEFIHVCKKGKPPLSSNKEGDKEYQDVWRIQRKMGKDEDHATKKPIELCERAIRHGSKYKNVIVDFFGGSGSTLIASEKNNRLCYMMELEEKYCDVTINRWQNFTGKQAIHSETGKTFSEMKENRI